VSTVIVNGKRLRVGDRLTKAGMAAEVHFDKLVVEHLKGIGAVAAPNAYGWQLETTLGGLRVGSRGHYIVQVFDDWPRAKAAGFDHWKWNFHYEIGAAEDEVDHWKRQLARVLPPIECDVGTLAFR
jgi:hypothetical protein